MLSTESQNFFPAAIQNFFIYQIHPFCSYPYLKHAVFTRNGGVSQGPYRSLNLGSSVGDNPELVQQNYTIASRAVDIASNKITSCHLVHGTDIITVTRANQQKMMGYADGLITSETDIFLFMRFADCTPLIFFDPVENAVGLTHAGWRGTIQNAAGATIKAMIEELGCCATNIIAAIGPSIGPCCYQVGPDVISQATQTFTDADSLLYPNSKPKHAQFDMWEANRRQLAQAGVKQIIQSRLCTACRTDEFFSHRAEKGKTGRFGVIIGMQGETQ